LVIAQLRVSGLDDFEKRIAELTAGLPPVDERTRRLIDRRRKLVADGTPDASRGAGVFAKHCAACHRIGQQGEKIGPNLDGVGIRGLERLLEDVLDPSRNVDQAFRTTQIVTADGRVTSGLALREEGEILVLADTQGKEVRVAKSDIETRTQSQLSLMPANVPDAMSEPEFVDLVGYLLEQRVAGGK
jgi:putative heme-binding domain-containing protein